MDVDRTPGGPGGTEGESPDEALARLGTELADAVVAAIPRWVERSVTDLLRAWTGTPGAVEVESARVAGATAVAAVGPELRRLLAADVDDQWTNPMSIVRRAVAPATAALRAAGVGEVVRSPEDVARFPDDVYGLTPGTFAELDPSLHEPGILWGAVKARAHLARHRPTRLAPEAG